MLSRALSIGSFKRSSNRLISLNNSDLYKTTWRRKTSPFCTRAKTVEKATNPSDFFLYFLIIFIAYTHPLMLIILLIHYTNYNGLRKIKKTATDLRRRASHLRLILHGGTTDRSLSLPFLAENPTKEQSPHHPHRLQSHLCLHSWQVRASRD